MQQERRRIDGIRAQMARQEQQLRAQFDAEREAVDGALALFDPQVETREAQLGAARRTADRISEGMRAAPFIRTLALLRARTEQLAALAAEGASTTSEPTGDTLAAPPSESPSADAVASRSRFRRPDVRQNVTLVRRRSADDAGDEAPGHRRTA